MKKMNGKLTSSEAVYGFAAWLTTREERTIMSAKDDSAPVAELIKEFCEVNSLGEPGEGWENNLTHPND